MIRFIDLRGQGTGSRFAFYDTVRDHFLELEGEQAWDVFLEFAEVCDNANLRQRCKRLCPPWAFEKEEYPHVKITNPPKPWTPGSPDLPEAPIKRHDPEAIKDAVQEACDHDYVRRTGSDYFICLTCGHVTDDGGTG